MNVILLEKIGNLGGLGDEVSVKPGFARNYLLPQGKAVTANDENRSLFEGRRAELEASANAKLAEANTRAEKLFDKQLSIAVKSGEEGRLYGSVGTQNIADALTAEGIPVERSEIRMPEGAIRVVGEYEIAIQLHTDVAAQIKVVIVPE